VYLYVYYRVQAGKEVSCRAAVAAMRAELGVPRRLLRRADDPATWMEIYEDVDEIFVTRLEEAAVRHGIPGFLAPDSRRHLERFVECA
jgi:uncharacterized protein DUF4936